MSLNSKKYPLILFVFALPLLIITDWYFHGFGIAVFFICVSTGLIIDQIQRMNSSSFLVNDEKNYKYNKILKIIGLIITVNSPLMIIYLNNSANLGLILFIITLVLGAVLNWSANSVFPFSRNNE